MAEQNDLFATDTSCILHWLIGLRWKTCFDAGRNAAGSARWIWHWAASCMNWSRIPAAGAAGRRADQPPAGPGHICADIDNLLSAPIPRCRCHRMASSARRCRIGRWSCCRGWGAVNGWLLCRHPFWSVPVILRRRWYWSRTPPDFISTVSGVMKSMLRNGSVIVSVLFLWITYGYSNVCRNYSPQLMTTVSTGNSWPVPWWPGDASALLPVAPDR